MRGVDNVGHRENRFADIVEGVTDGVVKGGFGHTLAAKEVVSIGVKVGFVAEWAGFVDEARRKDGDAEFPFDEGDEDVIVKAVVGVAPVISSKWLGRELG